MNELLDTFPQESTAYEGILSSLRSQIQQATNKAARDRLRKVGRKVLRNYHLAFPHLHTCQL